MRIALIGGVLFLVGLVAIATGALPLPAVGELAERVVPILVFVVAITIVAELAAEAGVFRALAEWLADVARGRGWLLWVLVVVLATLSTVFLSLDTTAVLLTPIVIALAQHARISPIPLALTTVWLANTGSLLLPVSNLTNLLAAHELGGMTPLAFAAITWAPALVAVVVPAAVIFATRPRQIVARYTPEHATPVADRTLFLISAIVVALLIPAFVSGVEVWIPASIAAVILIGVFAVRKRSVLEFRLVPWQLVVFAGGLFLVMEAAHSIGATDVLAAVAGTGRSPLDLLQLAGAGATSANLINNLPAYLALEPFAGDPVRLVALLIGVNAGAIITPWGSLATLLWHERLVAMGVEISWVKFMLLGLVAAPLTVVAAVLALSLTA
ncbi:SLC13 family permease [Agromyces atrinae]|uniref:Arsenic transporter n=1 Tax=Agromyces atrinae TaxID=592376 RepID=A0A4Q2M9V1_9MICO|nr:SLC13 family permease [Agromyces atrinae]NYD67616.1 Na+/H+ antiporter NhaD/arsenite permease-like protein [Agromyces atrinae]RXZ88177.1 arsenic transporter [Agromyces atrinae]